MVAWYWLIAAFILGLVFATVMHYYFDYENTLTTILAGLAIPFAWIAMFPIVFFKNLRGVEAERFDKLKEVSGDAARYRHITKNIVLWHDPKAKQFFARRFLIRLLPKSEAQASQKEGKQ